MEKTGYAYRCILAGFSTAAFEGNAMALVLETLGSDEALDLRGLGVWFRTLLLRLHFTTDDEFANL